MHFLVYLKICHSKSLYPFSILTHGRQHNLCSEKRLCHLINRIYRVFFGITKNIVCNSLQNSIFSALVIVIQLGKPRWINVRLVLKKPSFCNSLHKLLLTGSAVLPDVLSCKTKLIVLTRGVFCWLFWYCTLSLSNVHLIWVDLHHTKWD